MRLAATLRDAEPCLTKLANRLCATSADARDLVQDTFERAVRQGVPSDVRNPRAWLCRTMHNLFIDRCRVAARVPAQEPLLEVHTARPAVEDEEPAWNRATVDDIRAALPEIDLVYREVYEMHTFQRRSYEDIAKRLGIEPVTVGTRLTRARKQLREVLIKRLGLETNP